MPSEPEISDYLQTLSEPEREEVEEEENDNVQVIFSQIEPYQLELLEECDSTAERNKVDEELDEDGLTPTVLEARSKRDFCQFMVYTTAVLSLIINFPVVPQLF